ncbi:MAG: hypothetical protein R3B06_07890 [Kofleriaceae bacterium]
MRSILIVATLLTLATAAVAQPTSPAGAPAPAAAAADTPAGDAPPAPIQPEVPAPPPTAAPMCRLAEEPPAPEPGKPVVAAPHSPMRQVCEDELAKDHDWWFNLQGRLRQNIHRQAAQEITTNNRHVVIAYGAMWILAVGFLLLMWVRQGRLRAEIARLERDLARVEREDGGAGS